MKHSFIGICVTFYMVFCMPYGAFSEDSFESKSMNFDVEMTKQEFIDQSTFYEEDPFDDDLLAYEVYLPKDWKRISSSNLENIKLSSWVLGEIAKFVSPPLKDDRATFVIRALEMKKYKSVEHWFRNFISIQGGFISSLKTFSPNLLHVEYSIFELGKNYSVRAVVQRSLNRVILSEYRIPVEFVERYSDNQKWTSSLFRIKRQDYGYAELADNHSYLRQADHLYPMGWMIKSGKYDSINEIWYSFGRTKMIKYRGKMIEDGLDYSRGFIKTLLLSKTVFTGYEDKVKEIIEKEKTYDFDNRIIELVDRGVGNKNNTVAFYPTKIYRPKKIHDEENQEYWIGVNESSNHYLIVYMKIPSRNFHYNLWAENVGAFNLILDTYTPTK